MMTFASTITAVKNMGSLKKTYGTFTNAGGDTGGNIDTGLDVCHGLTLQENGTATSANQDVVNETFPVAGNAVTIKTTDGADGYWEAFGR